MKGHQLVSIRMHKAKALSVYENPIGFVQGISEDIQKISPRDRRAKNQIYLKSISPNLPLVHKPLHTHSSSITETVHKRSESHNAAYTFVDTAKKPKKERIFKFDPNSKFSLHYHMVEEKELIKLNKELFPSEILEDIEYLPDYTPSVISKPLDLQSSNRANSENKRYESRTLVNLIKSRNEALQINMKKLRKSQFTTYSTGWGSFYTRNTNRTPRKTRGHMSFMLPDLKDPISNTEHS